MKTFQNLLPKPSLLLLILMAGLPQIGETIYSPALPEIASYLRVTASSIETTLTIYLIGFSCGTLVLGSLSDRIGRRPTMLLGFFLYCIGSLGCCVASSFWILFISRFIQAFGGSVGSVITQTIARDSFHGKDRSKVFTTVSISLSLSPVIGPIIGGVFTDFVGWRMIFLTLLLTGILLELYIYFSLPETRPPETQKISLLKVLSKMTRDPLVISYGIMIGGFHGMFFIFIAEGPFYIIDFLGIRPSLYGLLLFIPALSIAFGSYVSRSLIHRNFPENTLILAGVILCCISSLLLLIFTFFGFLSPDSKNIALMSLLAPLAGLFFGYGLSCALCLSHALKHYMYAAGRAGALFGGFYYIVIASLTSLMAFLHNGTEYPMPCLFVGIFVILFGITKFIIEPSFKEDSLTSL